MHANMSGYKALFGAKTIRPDATRYDRIRPNVIQIHVKYRPNAGMLGVFRAEYMSGVQGVALHVEGGCGLA